MHKPLRYLLTGLSFLFLMSARSQERDSVGTVDAPVIDTDTSISTSSSSHTYYFSELRNVARPDARHIPDSTVDRLRRNEEYWYANEAPVKEEKKPEKEEDSGIKSLTWLIMVAAFVALVIWFLASSQVRLFRRKSKSVAEDESGSDAGDGVFVDPEERDIQKAVAEKNFRLATRLLYLRTLKQLSDKQLIRYTHEKTNSEYLAQLWNTKYYKDFFRLTRNFEYTWYGQFDVGEELFGQIEKDFRQFKQQFL